jgi:hypothetical protein
MKMQLLQRVRTCTLASALMFTLCSARVLAQSNSGDSKPNASAMRDGQHDFDFELGSWKIHLKRLQNPLTGSNTWVEFDGTSVTRKVWDGRADIEEFEVDSPTGHIEDRKSVV